MSNHRVGRSPLGAAYRSRLGVLTRPGGVLIVGMGVGLQKILHLFEANNIRYVFGHTESLYAENVQSLWEFNLILDAGSAERAVDIISRIDQAGWRGRFAIFGERFGGVWNTINSRINEHYGPVMGMTLVDTFNSDEAPPDKFSPVEDMDITKDVSGLYHDATNFVEGGSVVAYSVDFPDPWIARNTVNGIDWILCADTNVGLQNFGDNEAPVEGSPNHQFFLNLAKIPVGKAE